MSQNQILGRGKVYFDKFLPGTKTKTGELYLGNTPALSLSAADTALDHYDSDAGLKVKDISITLQSDLTGSVQTDNISIENIALWFMGDSSKITQVASMAAVTEPLTVSPGFWYQLGVDDAHPAGVIAVSDFSVSDTAAEPAPITADNFTVDLVNGRFMVNVDSADVDADTEVTVSYKLAASMQEAMVYNGTQIFGAMRFVSNNPVGPQRSYYMPYVKLTSDGDYNLKGDDWQAMTFAMEVLQLDDTHQRIYVNGTPLAAS